MNELISPIMTIAGKKKNPLALTHSQADFSSPSHGGRGVGVGVEGYVFHAPYPVEGGQSLLLLLTSLAQKRGCKERGWPLLAGCLGSASAAWRPAPDESTGTPHGGTPKPSFVPVISIPYTSP